MIERKRLLDKLIEKKDKDIIKVITGIRRSGKSILLFNLYYDYLLSVGIEDSQIIKINLENMDNIELRNKEKLYAYIINKLSSKKNYIFIDEIQYVDGFEDVVNDLKNRGCDVYITGSNSKLLSSEINTKLRGRSIEIKVHTLSFEEVYEYTKGDKQSVYNSYQLYGGFPYAVTERNKEEKVEYLKMLENTVATKDIIDRYKIRNTDSFNRVYDFLLSNIGSLVSTKKIENTLKSQGHNITSDTISKYLDYLCDAFIFYKVYRYDIKGKEYLKTLNKYYVSDIGLRNSRMNYRQIEVTHTLENIIYLELIRRGYMVDIGKNRDKEIDFVARNSKNTYYIQVAYSIVDIDKKEQEISSFRKIDDGYKKIIITMDIDPFTILENGYIKMHVFDFLLDWNSLE